MTLLRESALPCRCRRRDFTLVLYRLPILCLRNCSPQSVRCTCRDMIKLKKIEFKTPTASLGCCHPLQIARKFKNSTGCVTTNFKHHRQKESHTAATQCTHCCAPMSWIGAFIRSFVSPQPRRASQDDHNQAERVELETDQAVNLVTKSR